LLVMRENPHWQVQFSSHSSWDDVERMIGTYFGIKEWASLFYIQHWADISWDDKNMAERLYEHAGVDPFDVDLVNQIHMHDGSKVYATAIWSTALDYLDHLIKKEAEHGDVPQRA
jgi:hypothetical protein